MVPTAVQRLQQALISKTSEEQTRVKHAKQWNAQKPPEVTWPRTPAGCERLTEPRNRRPAYGCHTVIRLRLRASPRRRKAPGRYGSWRRKGLEWEDAEVPIQAKTVILLWYLQPVEHQGFWCSPSPWCWLIGWGLSMSIGQICSESSSLDSFHWRLRRCPLSPYVVNSQVCIS